MLINVVVDESDLQRAGELNDPRVAVERAVARLFPRTYVIQAKQKDLRIEDESGRVVYYGASMPRVRAFFQDWEDDPDAAKPFQFAFSVVEIHSIDG